MLGGNVMWKRLVLKFVSIALAFATIDLIVNISGSLIGNQVVLVSADASSKQVVTTDYVKQDLQALLNGIQNSSDAVKSNGKVAEEYTFLSQNLTTDYDSPTEGTWSNTGASGDHTSIADLLHDMGLASIYDDTDDTDDTTYYGLVNPDDDKLQADNLAKATAEANQDRIGAKWIYDQFYARLMPANKLIVQTNWNLVQKDKNPNDIEDDLSSFYDTMADGIVTWGKNVTIKTPAIHNTVYTISDAQKSPRQYTAIFIPKNKIKEIIGRAYKMFKEARKEIIKSNRCIYEFEALFATYNSSNSHDLQADKIDGISGAWNFENNFVKTTGGKTTYKQGLKLFKKAYSYRGVHDIVINGYYFNHRRSTLKLSKWDGYVTPEYIKLKRHLFYYYPAS